MPGRSRFALVPVLLLALLWLPTSARADATPPTIEEMWWEPRYPIHPSTITLFARVTDGDGVQSVDASFCYIPGLLCLPVSMGDPEGDGTFQAVPEGPGGTSTEPGADGAAYWLIAMDKAGNLATAEKEYVLFPDSISITLEAPLIEANSGKAFTVNGTAFYEGNTTAPAEGVSVDVGYPGSTVGGVVDAQGRFSVTLVAPSSEGSWTITAAATDRSLMDTEESTLIVSTIPRPDLLISDIRLSPEVPVAGPLAVSFHLRNVGTQTATDAHVVVRIDGSPPQTILDDTYTIPARVGDIPLVAQWIATPGPFTIRISIDSGGSINELNEGNNEIAYPLSVPPVPAPEIPAGLWVGGGVATLLLAVVLTAWTFRRRISRVHGKVAAVAAVIVAGVIIAAAAFSALGAPPPAPLPAPPFSLRDINEIPLNSEGLRGNVTLLEISGTWCEPCRIVENAFKDLFPAYRDRVVFLTVFIPPLNNKTSLEIHRQDREIPEGWHLATDTDNVQSKFGVASLPRVFVIDREGYVTLDWLPTPYTGLSEEVIRQAVAPALDRTLEGRSAAINVSALSIPALLVVAAFLSFFSPCSFPVLPAFMAYYLRLDAGGEKKASPRVATGRGFVASLGMVTVYGIIALVVFAAGIAAQHTLPYLPPVIGVVLILAAVLSLLPFQYHWITRPFVALKNRVATRLGGRWTPGMRTKLFTFGAGYGAAGFACVAPPFIGAMLNASALGQPEQAAFGLILYVVIVVALMIAVTLALTLAGDRALKRIRVWSAAMKYISAVALLIAGGYLLWLFYISSVAG